ncbi:MAG TPA: hypothetical protein VFN02_00755, partial [Ktedonobacteraceae bacterium]|nr:hypothetical protein [Ktedonobacteraceae bacterium]
MAAREQVILHGIPGWVIAVCKQIATWRGFVGTNLIGLAINVLATWLTSANDTNFVKNPLGTLMRHWPVGVAMLGAGWALF